MVGYGPLRPREGSDRDSQDSRDILGRGGPEKDVPRRSCRLGILELRPETGFQSARPSVSGAMTATIPSRHASRAYPRAAHRACAPLPQHPGCRVPDAGWAAHRHCAGSRRPDSHPSPGCAYRTRASRPARGAAPAAPDSTGRPRRRYTQERAAGDELRLDCGDTPDQREKTIVGCHVCTPELATPPEPTSLSGQSEGIPAMKSAGSVSSDGGECIVQWWSPYLQMALSVSPGGCRYISGPRYETSMPCRRPERCRRVAMSDSPMSRASGVDLIVRDWRGHQARRRQPTGPRARRNTSAAPVRSHHRLRCSTRSSRRPGRSAWASCP